MLPQVEMTQRLRQLCQADSWPVAASAALQPQDLERAYRAAWGGVLTCCLVCCGRMAKVLPASLSGQDRPLFPGAGGPGLSPIPAQASAEQPLPLPGDA